MPTSKTSNPGQAANVRARQQVIGRVLRRIYDGVVQEPVPGDFLALLKKMDEQEKEPCGKIAS